MRSRRTHSCRRQALLVPQDFIDRRQYLHARRTLTRLLELGAVPIINENDAIASDEIRYGDNDRLSALVAHNMAAVAARAAHRPRRPLHRRPAHAPGRRADRVGEGRRPAARDLGRARRQRSRERWHGEQARVGADRVVVRRADGDRQRRSSRRVGRRRRRANRSGPASRLETARLSARKLWIALRGACRGQHHGRRRRPASAPRAQDEPAARRGRLGRGPLPRGRHRRRARRRRSDVRPRHGVRRFEPAPQGSPACRPATSPTESSTRSSIATTWLSCRDEVDPRRRLRCIDRRGRARPAAGRHAVRLPARRCL